MKLHLFPALCAFWFLEKTALCKNHVGGTLLKTQLTQNSSAQNRISGNCAIGNCVMGGLDVFDIPKCYLQESFVQTL